MGLSYSTHLGPYVECVTFKVDAERKLNSCPNKDCIEYQEEVYGSEKRFCSSCGHKIDIIILPIKKTNASIADILQEMNEALFPPLGDDLCDWSAREYIDLWLPNRRRPNPESRKFSFNSHETIRVEVMNEKTIWNELSEFQCQYQKELNILRKHYGLENVKVRWGLIHSIS